MAGGTQKQERHTQHQQGRHEGLRSQDPSRGSTRLQRQSLLIPWEGQSGPQVVTVMSPYLYLQEDRGGPGEDQPQKAGGPGRVKLQLQARAYLSAPLLGLGPTCR